MRDKKSPRGKLFHFSDKSEWSDDNIRCVQLSSRYRSHMVVVLGRASDRPPGWVRIVTVTSTLPVDFTPDTYLPIRPTRKHPGGGVQLKLCGSFEAQTWLRLRSYLRIDNPEEVPLEILDVVPRSDGLDTMLKQESFDTAVNLLRRQEAAKFSRGV